MLKSITALYLRTVPFLHILYNICEIGFEYEEFSIGIKKGMSILSSLFIITNLIS